MSQPEFVALTRVHVNYFTSVLPIAMDNVFSSECVVLFKRFKRLETLLATVSDPYWLR